MKLLVLTTYIFHFYIYFPIALYLPILHPYVYFPIVLPICLLPYCTSIVYFRIVLPYCSSLLYFPICLFYFPVALPYCSVLLLFIYEDYDYASLFLLFLLHTKVLPYCIPVYFTFIGRRGNIGKNGEVTKEENKK